MPGREIECATINLYNVYCNKSPWNSGFIVAQVNFVNPNCCFFIVFSLLESETSSLTLETAIGKSVSFSSCSFWSYQIFLVP